MIVAFDASVLVYVVSPNASAPTDPATGQPIEHCAARIQFLLETLQRDKATIVIPTPALAEILVRAEGAGPAWIGLIERSKHFRIADFDKLAAIEHAAYQVERRQGLIRPVAPSRPQAKFDDQIVAIAAVAGATILYSDDGHIKKLAPPRLDVIGIGELLLPPSSAQGALPLDEPPATP